MKTTVVNIKHQPTRTYDVYIGRPSQWGNPFSVETYSRGESIRRYKTWFESQLKADGDFALATLALKGKRLGCWCKPLACHGDVIVAWLGGRT